MKTFTLKRFAKNFFILLSMLIVVSLPAVSNDRKDLYAKYSKLSMELGRLRISLQNGDKSIFLRMRSFEEKSDTLNNELWALIDPTNPEIETAKESANKLREELRAVAESERFKADRKIAVEEAKVSRIRQVTIDKANGKLKSAIDDIREDMDLLELEKQDFLCSKSEDYKKIYEELQALKLKIKNMFQNQK
tara:strand:+ start:553 stop:1128 length:576 start_codon:yes stop_codon:yes gene_type:complete